MKLLKHNCFFLRGNENHTCPAISPVETVYLGLPSWTLLQQSQWYFSVYADLRRGKKPSKTFLHCFATSDHRVLDLGLAALSCCSHSQRFPNLEWRDFVTYDHSAPKFFSREQSTWTVPVIHSAPPGTHWSVLRRKCVCLTDSQMLSENRSQLLLVECGYIPIVLQPVICWKWVTSKSANILL